MLNNKKFVILIIVLPIVLIVSLIGCNNTGNPTSTPITTNNSLTPEITTTTTDSYQLSRARETIAKTIDACSGVTTVKMDVSSTQVLSNFGKESYTQQWFFVSRTEMNRAEKQFKLFSSSINDLRSWNNAGENEWISSTKYWNNGWYYYLNDEGYPSGKKYWLKVDCEKNSASYDWASYDYLSQQVENLRTGVDVTYSGTEMIDGVLCDIIQIEHDKGKWAEWFKLSFRVSQISETDLYKYIKKDEIKEWIARDTSLPVKFEMVTYIEVPTSDIERSRLYSSYFSDFEKITHGFITTGRFYDYGQPVDTVLPPEVTSAQEINPPIREVYYYDY